MQLSVGEEGSVEKRTNKACLQRIRAEKTSLGSHISHLIPILDEDLLPIQCLLPILERLRHKQSLDILCREQLLHWTDGQTESFQPSPYHLSKCPSAPAYELGTPAGISSSPPMPHLS